MIIWLASYPKSGNTLLRSILSSYFYSNDGVFKFENLAKISQFPMSNHLLSVGVNIDDEKEVFKNFINAQNFINQDKKKIKFFKTHSSLSKMYDCNFTDLQNSLGVIYIVRDPRNVVTSLAHHYNLSIDQATETMIDKSRFMDKTVKNCRVFLGSWGYNYSSFKYLNSLGMKSHLNMIKLNKAIKTTDFENMKKKEQIETFYEASIDTKTGKRKNFFNLGPKNDWRKILDLKNKDKIEKNFESEMIELGYL